VTAKESAKARQERKIFERQRRALQSALPKATKAAASNSGWRTAQGTLFREMEGWFVEVRAIPWVAEAKTAAELRCKPMGLDPLFWQLVGMEENIETPLSFRAFGAFACRTPALRQTEIPEENSSPERIATRMVNWATEQFQFLKGTQTIDGFVEFIRTHPVQMERNSYFATLVTGFLLQGKDEEALAICNEAKVRSGGIFLSDNGGFIFNRSGEMITFTDLAIKWIAEKQQSRAIN
jgi:hypothetical protein